MSLARHYLMLMDMVESVQESENTNIFTLRMFHLSSAYGILLF